MLRWGCNSATSSGRIAASDRSSRTLRATCPRRFAQHSGQPGSTAGSISWSGLPLVTAATTEPPHLPGREDAQRLDAYVIVSHGVKLARQSRTIYTKRLLARNTASYTSPAFRSRMRGSHSASPRGYRPWLAIRCHTDGKATRPCASSPRLDLLDLFLRSAPDVALLQARAQRARANAMGAWIEPCHLRRPEATQIPGGQSWRSPPDARSCSLPQRRSERSREAGRPPDTSRASSHASGRECHLPSSASAHRYGFGPCPQRGHRKSRRVDRSRASRQTADHRQFQGRPQCCLGGREDRAVAHEERLGRLGGEGRVSIFSIVRTRGCG